MYTQDDLTQIRAQQKKRWIILAIPCALMLAGLVVSVVIRMEWLAILLTSLLAGLIIFSWDLLIKPLRCYERHVQGVLEGITHDLDGIFKSHAEDVSLVEGVAYHAVTISAGDPQDEEDDRLLYFDVQKPFPPLNPGDRVHVRYHDRELAELVKLC